MANKFSDMRKQACSDFSSEGRRTLALDAVDLAEKWLQNKGLSYEYVTTGVSASQTTAYKSELKADVKAGLWRYRKEGRYGILGSFILAVIFAVAVQLVARWIIDNFFC